MTIQGTFGRYQIIAELARGGMGTVFRAHDPNFERDVALKVLPAQFLHELNFRQRFEREAKTIAALEHPAIVPVYDFGEEQGQPYLVMRFMDGGTLTDLLQQGPLSVKDTLRILERVGPALDEAHAIGIIHRDVKPDNILFDKRGDAYLSDFGLVKLIDMTDSISFAMVIGTPAYMSPEQVHADEELDARSDIYSLGVTLFEMLAGQVPYDDKVPTKLMMKHVLDPIPDIHALKPDLPDGCATIITRAMAKQPERRYATVGEMTVALGAVAAGTPLEGVPAPGVGKKILARFPLQAPESGQARPASIHTNRAHVFQGHADSVWSVAWSPDGSLLASASSDNSVIIWNMRLGKQAGKLNHSDALHGMAWSHDGTLLACGTSDARVVVWNMGTGEPVYALEGHSAQVHSVAWSPDDARLVSASDDMTLILWDAAVGEALGRLEGHSRRVRSVAWSPDGAFLVSGSADRKAIVWDAFTGQRLTTLEGHTFRVNDVAWSPDSTRLVSGSYDGALSMWEAGTWSPLGTLEGHADSVHCVSWSPDGALLASGAHDDTISIWSAQTGDHLASLTGHSAAVRAVAWSLAGAGEGEATLASGSDDHQVMVWKVAT